MSALAHSGCQSVQAAVTKHHRLGALNNTCDSHSSRGWEFQVKVQVGSLFGEGPPPWLVDGYPLPVSSPSRERELVSLPLFIRA